MIRSAVIEACVETIVECQNALKCNADQLEVCNRLDLGGLTPDIEFVKEINESIKLPVKVMIRGREVSFIYNELEISEMIASIVEFKSCDIVGFVFGALYENEAGRLQIDMGTVYKLCRAAAPYPVTFHKAIDLCHNITEEVEKLKLVPDIRYILSSGGQPTAEAGTKMLIDMQKIGKPNIEIIAAGKITKDNLDSIIGKTGLSFFHGRKIV
ncbi:MAG: hypothetical protein IPO98_04930 [Saprospiraceae bacterium]|nr:hypothetical protein [Saprospiraceae bacterium]